MRKLSTAILLTGTAARLSQEVAIIDQLRLTKGLVINENQTFLAGFSSGSLNLLAINACFRTVNPLSWDDYYKDEILEQLTNSQIYVKTHPYYWDTLPLRYTVKMFLKAMDCKKLSDLPFNSTVLAFCLDKLKTYWVDSSDTKKELVSLCDLMMASTAFPYVFPSQRINGVDEKSTNLPESAYIDGGTGGVFKYFKKNLKNVVKTNGVFDKIYIVSPMREAEGSISQLPADFLLLGDELKEIMHYLEKISMKGFLKFLKKLEKANRKKKIANSIFVCIPKLEKNFDILDFSDQMTKYEVVEKWALQYPDELAIELTDYLGGK